MAEFYQYTKARREFGRPPAFADTAPISTAFYPTAKDHLKDEDYVLRNPNFIELDNITELSVHQVNTMRVSTGDKGMFHREGGWPETIDPTEPQQYARFMKKIDKDQGFAAQVKSLCEIAERCMLKNNQIDMYEEYFVNEESDHVVENISTKTLMLFKYITIYAEILSTFANEALARSVGTRRDPTNLLSLMLFPDSNRLLTR